jgi:phosphoribosylaminoimidazole-succinocarboxamide synthase
MDASVVGLIPPAPLVYSGKVRDTYELSNGRLLMVASDRISAFDVILPATIPGKGEILTQLSLFWFEQTESLIPNHLTGESVADLAWSDESTEALERRSMVVHQAERIPVECVVRGYLAGSGWAEYKRTGSVAGHTLPANLRVGSRLPAPVFTPARKNDGGHDENITRADLEYDIGSEIATRLETVSLSIYQQAAESAAARGVIIADTKFEFGFIDGHLTLIDEVLTPDSSRFWDTSTWQPGREPDSWDKQYLRNWLVESGWDREPPAPALPDEVIQGTRSRYLEAFQRLTGLTLHEWLGRNRVEARA